MKWYRYTENRNRSEGTSAIVLDRDFDGSPTRFLLKGGEPGRMTDEEHERYTNGYVLELAEEREASLPDGLPDEYDEMTAAEVNAFLANASPTEVDAVLEYESSHKDRVTITTNATALVDERTTWPTHQAGDVLSPTHGKTGGE